MEQQQASRPTANYTVGQRVICNGYEGRISCVCSGQLIGMYEVRVPGGTVCVSAASIQAI